MQQVQQQILPSARLARDDADLHRRTQPDDGSDDLIGQADADTAMRRSNESSETLISATFIDMDGAGAASNKHKSIVDTATTFEDPAAAGNSLGDTPAASARAAKSTVSKMAHLDGMRGVAALWVFFVHCNVEVNRELHEFVLAYQRWNASVPLFFILSGRIITASVLRSKDTRKLVSCMIRRPFRLLLPIMSIMLLDYFVMKWEKIGSIWEIVTTPVWFLASPFDDGPFPHVTGVVWTLQHEFLWSNLLYMFTFVLLAFDGNDKARYVILIGSFAWFQITHSWMTHFLAGLFIADLAQHGHIRRYTQWRFSPIVTAALVLASAVVAFRFSFWKLGDTIDAAVRSHQVQKGKQGVSGHFWQENFVVFLFSFAVMFALETSRWMQAVFSLSVFRFLGHVSFSMYLIHPYIIKYLRWLTEYNREWMGKSHATDSITILINMAAVLAAGYALTPLVDDASIAVGRWVETVVVEQPWSVAAVRAWVRRLPIHALKWARPRVEFVRGAIDRLSAQLEYQPVPAAAAGKAAAEA
ncbi:hypothetical protein HK105_204999 [Polyrhizophydium stewartii]|uniref:Acyltransferase 3 domain-containing protein n=1 Tax=Polyrhizophydium stewartii TaxID=2732419 RepID=A0ABR4N767_9FUNG